MKYVIALLLTCSLATAEHCAPLPEIVYNQIKKQDPRLLMLRKEAERACESVGLCAVQMGAREDLNAFHVQCIPAEEWAEVVKQIKKQLPPQM